MSDGLMVAKGERNVVRVFALAEGGDVLSPDSPRLAALLGVDRLDSSHVTVVDTADLADIGLSGYLTEGYGAVEAQVFADKARLDALRGLVLIATSQAFPDTPLRLSPQPGATLIGTYREDAPAVRFEPLPSAAAQGVITPPAPGPDPAAKGRIGLMIGIAAVVLLVVIVGVKLFAR